MNNRYKWFVTAMVGSAGVYLLVDANESVKNLLTFLTFIVISMYGQAEIDKERLKEINSRLWQELDEMKKKIDR
jgi:hypothetical protein